MRVPTAVEHDTSPNMLDADLITGADHGNEPIPG
jgi:hypothetical protein